MQHPNLSSRLSSVPLLSIVIATRNRIPCAISAIESILAMPNQDLELVVQDNSDSPALKEYVAERVDDGRLRYRYTAKPLSMVANFNAAMELATGEYVCLIGDDDGVNPEIMEAAAWARSNDLDSLGIRQTSFYLWPGTGLASSLFTKVVGGSLSVQPFSGKIVEIDLEKEVRALFRNGGLYYLRHNLPKAYHGLARRSCFEAIKARTGNYFGGTSPDIFSSIAIACVSKRAAFIEYPLTIPGHCSAAATTHHVAKAHLRPIEDAPHFKNRGDYQWCDLVPRVFIGETFWVDSEVAAVRAVGREDLVAELNLPKLAAHCVGNYRGIVKPVINNMFRGLRKTERSSVIGAAQFAWGLVTGPGASLLRRAWGRLLIASGLRVNYEFYNLENMSDCTAELSNHLRSKGYSFAACASRAR